MRGALASLLPSLPCAFAYAYFASRILIRISQVGTGVKKLAQAQDLAVGVASIMKRFIRISKALRLRLWPSAFGDRKWAHPCHYVCATSVNKA